MTTTSREANAHGVRWDLSPLAPDAATAIGQIALTLDGCRAFAVDYRGRVADLDGPGLAAALARLGELHDSLSRYGSYAHLRESVDVTDPETRDLNAQVERSYVEASNLIRFFELEWLALDDDTASRLADAPEVAADRHYLLAERRYAPFTLSEVEERMLAERAPAASGAWHTLFGQITSTLETSFDAGEGATPHDLNLLMSYLRSDDRELRRRSFTAMYDMLRPHTSTIAHCYDTLVADRLAMDRLRGYDGPMAAAHLRNELEPQVVEAMIDSVGRHYGLAQRWFTTKADLLGIDKLTIFDQYAPIGEGRTVGFDEGIDLVTTAFASFSERLADVARDFMTDGRVDAEPRQGKRGGAFCSPISREFRPYVLLNHTDRMSDVLTIAHEFGHGMHFEFAYAKQSPFSATSGLAVSEIPSTFAEQITYDQLLSVESDPRTRQALACERVEAAFATIFRQVVLARYEESSYAQRAAGTALTAERLADNWLAANLDYYGDVVEMPDDYRYGWSYIPHFIHTRFYTYSYAFALLSSFALIARYRRDGEAFVDRYIRFLERGGSASPAELLGDLGLKLDEPAVWDDGFAELERMIDEARAAG